MKQISKLNNVANNDVVKKTVYDKLVMKINAIDIKIPSNNWLVTKTHDDSVKQCLEKRIKDVNKKILNASGLVKKTDYNTKITYIDYLVYLGLVTISALKTKVTEIENKIHDITNQATKTDLNTN